jgi:aminoglycoside phosphotransferase (APT) family kinase protein
VIGIWKQFLVQRAEEWSLPSSGDWKVLAHNNYHPACSNLNLLWFHGDDAYPRIVTKMCRDDAALKAEFDSLRKVHERAAPWVPRPFHFGIQGSYWGLWMEGMPGCRLQAADAGSPSILSAAVKMLAGVHNRLKESGPADPKRHTNRVSEPLRLLEGFGQSAVVRSACSELERRSSPEWLAAWPIIPQHGDLCVGNVIYLREQWSIVDWETFGIVDLPFYDLFTLLFSLLRSGGVTPDKWDASLVRQIPEAVACYAALTGLPTAGLSVLLPLSLVNWFHVQWMYGRRAFLDLMYLTMEHYFSNVDEWERIFLPESARKPPASRRFPDE